MFQLLVTLAAMVAYSTESATPGVCDGDRDCDASNDPKALVMRHIQPRQMLKDLMDIDDDDDHRFEHEPVDKAEAATADEEPPTSPAFMKLAYAHKISVADVSQPYGENCRWRSTANCSVDGEREPERDMDCSLELPWCKGTSGWCDCNWDSIRQADEPGWNCTEIQKKTKPFAANCTDEHCTNFTCDIACSPPALPRSPPQKLFQRSFPKRIQQSPRLQPPLQPRPAPLLPQALQPQ